MDLFFSRCNVLFKVYRNKLKIWFWTSPKTRGSRIANSSYSQYKRRCDKIQPRGLSRRSKTKFSAYFGISFLISISCSFLWGEGEGVSETFSESFLSQFRREKKFPQSSEEKIFHNIPSLKDLDKKKRPIRLILIMFRSLNIFVLPVKLLISILFLMKKSFSSTSRSFLRSLLLLGILCRF